MDNEKIMNQAAVEAHVKSLKTAKRQKEDLDAYIEYLEDCIKSIMEESNTYEYKGDDWKVTWNMISSTRFNQKTFKEQNPDLFSKYQTVSESRRFNVT